MGLEPVFSHTKAAWPPAGAGAWPPEPDDPDFAIPRGALQFPSPDAAGNIASSNADVTAASFAQLNVARTTPERSRKWTAAIVISCLLHAAVAAVLLIASGKASDPDDLTQIEGGDQSGVMVVGNAADDQSSAGSIANDDPDVTKVTLVPMLAPKPVETVEAEPVTDIETVQPSQAAAVEALPMETFEPVQETAEPQPADDDAVVQQPAIPVLTAKPTETTQTEPDKTAPVETTETVVAEDATAPKPAEKARDAKPPEAKRQLVEKPVERAERQRHGKAAKTSAKPEKPAKQAKARTRAGAGGRSDADSRRGAANGRDGAETVASKGGKKSASGNAKVSNYPGKVAAKLRRVARRISSSASAKARGNARIAFVVAANGGIGGLRLVASSGSPELDQAALAIVRRAAPFPPIPPEAGRANWAFTLPIGPF